MVVTKKKTDRQKKTVYQQTKRTKDILDDGIAKHVEGWKLKKSIEKDHNVL